MSNVYLFAWGLFATLLAVGPLVVAAYLDFKKSKAITPTIAPVIVPESKI